MGIGGTSRAGDIVSGIRQPAMGYPRDMLG
jgi:hypothetical protein